MMHQLKTGEKMSDKEITITDASNRHKFICFNLNGLEDGILVGLPDKYSNCITVSYKGETKIVPFDAKTEDLEELNSDENVIKPSRLKESDKITTTLSMDKETYDWLTTPSEEDDDIGYWQHDQVTELDDETFDEFEKDVMNPEPDMEKVEAAKKIFEGVDKIPVDTSDLWKHELTYGKPHLLELMDEWGVNGTNYADFRSVIQEHCFDKGLYTFDDIEKSWKSHVQSLKDVVKSVKRNS